MRHLFVAIGLLFTAQLACSQKQQAPFNLDLEQIEPQRNYPKEWFKWGMPSYEMKSDSLEKYEGRFSLLIQPSSSRKTKEFGCPVVSIPVTFSGKEVELSAYLKLSDVQDGFAGLLLRIDGEGRSLQFNNMQKENVHGTIDWKKYTIKLPLDKGAKTIFVAALHTGTGKVWADNFSLKIDGEEIGSSSLKPLITYKADTDHEFDKGSGLSLSQLNAEQAENLALLGKAWGFLKYYHPQIAAGNVNWDYALFRILPSYLAAKSQIERNETLLRLVRSLGEIQGKASSEKYADKEIKMRPVLNWIENSKELGAELSQTLIAIKNCKKGKEHYYVSFAPNVGNPIFTNERSYSSSTYPDDGFRLLSLYRYWNMVNYFFPYKYLINEDWENVLAEFIPTFLNAKDEQEYTLTTLKIIARIHDTHAGLWGGNKALAEFKGKKQVPFKAQFIENKLVVTGYYADTLGIKNQIFPGDIITKINGKSIKELIEFYEPLCPASNHEMLLRDLPGNYLFRTNNESLQLELLREGKQQEISVAAIDKDKLNFKLDYAWNPDAPARYLIKQNIGYLLPSKYKNKDLPEIKTLFSNTKGLIIDMRCYPSEFMVFSFGSYLKSEATDFVKFSLNDFNTPGLFKLSKPLKNGEKNKSAYLGKIIILVNHQTQSQAEYTTMAFQSRPNVTVIGNRTAGADGNVSQIVLPGNIQTSFSGIGIYYPDGSETQQVGVKIDIPISPTIQGIKAGKDELLEKAIELIEKN